MIGIKKEMIVFFQALLAGSIVFWTYTLLRILRKLIKHNLFFVSVEDFFFWLGVAVYLFIQLYNTSNGGLRWNFILGVVVGAILPPFLIGKYKKIRRKKGKKVIDK